MRVIAFLMTTLILSGCGASGPAMPQARTGSVESKSLGGDLAKRLAPIAARKAVQVGLNVAIKNDTKAVAEFKETVAKKPAAEQVTFLNKRLKALQRAITGAEVALAANVALSKRDDVAAVREALQAAKAEDKQRAKDFDEKGADTEKIASLQAWAEALHEGMVKAEAAF